jgi:hypothetical protein
LKSVDISWDDVADRADEGEEGNDREGEEEELVT